MIVVGNGSLLAMNLKFNHADYQSHNWIKLWAKSKPQHALWKHMLDVAAVSLALPNPLKKNGWSDEQTALVVGLHDVGKADAAFQRQVPSLFEEVRQAGFPDTADTPCRHERLSFRFLKKKLKGTECNSYLAAAIARAVVVHHGHWDEVPRDVGEPYATAQENLCHMLEEILCIKQIPQDTPHDLSSFGIRLSGHIVICDWIASNEEFFTDRHLVDVSNPENYFEKAKEVAQEWVAKLGLGQSNEPGKPNDVVASTRPIQQVLLENDIPPGLVVVEAPMGEGKTEAAWILSEKWREHGYRGAYMALPTMATSDSLFSRYSEHYLQALHPNESALLVHGMAWLRDEKEPERVPEMGEPGDDHSLASAWFRPTRRAMLAAHGVGTVDQAMLAGMNVKFGFLRLYGLANRVLVIDEVHAYDAYMSAIIARLLQWCACLKIPVILLSATLSSKQREAMLEAYGATGGDPGPDAPYPLVTVAEPGKEAWTIRAKASSSRRLKIEMYPGLLGDAKKTAALAIDVVDDGGCCCVILNTVKQAQVVYRELKLPSEEKLLFHARFTAADRERIANEVLAKFSKDMSNRPKKFILVATQVVEQSLDVDFDHMITEIAPIDLLLQRSGRMHRHRRRGFDPVLHVLLPENHSKEFGGTGYVYARKPLLRTQAILSDRNELNLPDDFRPLIELCYGCKEWENPSVDWTAIRQADEEWIAETDLLRNQGRQFSLCEPSRRIFRPVNNDPVGDDSDDGNGWRAKTRLGANDRTALLVNVDELQSIAAGELPMSLVRNLYRRTLKLPSYLPLFSPTEGFTAAVEARGKLRGLVLLPLDANAIWQGDDDKGRRYQISYNNELGLMAGRVQ